MERRQHLNSLVIFQGIVEQGHHLALLEAEFRAAFRRVPATVLAYALGKVDGSGIDWRGCSKGYMAEQWALAQIDGGRRLGGVHLDAIRSVVKAEQKRLRIARKIHAAYRADCEKNRREAERLAAIRATIPAETDLVAALGGLLILVGGMGQGNGPEATAARELLDRWERGRSELAALGKEV